MKAGALLSPGWRAWAGLVGGAAGWGLHHQAGSNLNYADCARWDGATAVGIGLAAFALVLVSGWISWTAWRAAGGEAGRSQEPAGRFVAALSLMAAALFALTVLVQVAAGLILPGCWR